MSSYNEAAVYWLHLQEHTDPNSEGYIGVSKNPISRMAVHLRHANESRHHNCNLINAVASYGPGAIITEVLLYGEELYCYEIEHDLRPGKNIGWNIAEGGRSGSGPKFGVQKDKEKLAIRKQKNAELRKAREDRIAAGNPTPEDLQFVEKEKEKLIRKKRIELGLLPQEKLPISLLDARPICKTCNKNFCAVNYKRNDVTHYRSICDGCGKARSKAKPKIRAWENAGYKKKTNCDLCGFKSLYPTQITVFHIDGNLNNVAFNNLRSICLNCVEVVKRKEITWKRGDLQVDY